MNDNIDPLKAELEKNSGSRSRSRKNTNLLKRIINDNSDDERNMQIKVETTIKQNAIKQNINKDLQSDNNLNNFNISGSDDKDEKSERSNKTINLINSKKNKNKKKKTFLRQGTLSKKLKKKFETLNDEISNEELDETDEKDDELEIFSNIRHSMDKIFTFEVRRYFDLIISILSLISFLLYMFLTYYQEFLKYFDYFDYFVCSIYIVDFVIYVLLSQHKLYHITSLKSFLDIISFLPMILLFFKKETIVSISQTSLVIVINIMRVLRVIRVFGIISAMKSENNIAKQIMVILFTIVMILLIFSGILQIVENEQVIYRINHSYNPFLIEMYKMRTQFHHYTYFCIITISTVGFGDITTITELGKAMVVLLIIITIALIPKQSNELIQLIGAQSEYERINYKSSNDTKHLIITGDINIDSLENFCAELFHPDHGGQYKHMIIINTNYPTIEIQNLMRTKAYENFIFYIEGNPMIELNLSRSDLIRSKFCIIFTEKNSVESNITDYKNILLALLIKKFVYNNSENIGLNGYCNFKLSLQLLKSENKYHYYNSIQSIYKKKMPLDNLIIIEEIKMNLLAKSCLTPGIMAMIGNLVMSSGNTSFPSHSLDNMWLKEYVEGRGHEIYRILLPDNCKSMTFIDIVKEIYMKDQAIAFALEIEYLKTSIIKLNPGNVSIESVINQNNDQKYNLLQIKLYIYIICSDKQIAEEVCSFDNDKSYTKYKNNNYNTDISDERERGNLKFGTRSTNNLNNAMINSYAPHLSLSYNLNNLYDSNSEDSQESDVEDDFTQGKRNFAIDYELDLNEYFISKNIDDFNYSKKDIMQHTIRDHSDINDHILVCGVSSNLFHFILPLRAKYLGKENLKYIVFLGENISENLLNVLSQFPYIIYIQGSPLLPENLYRANIMNASIAVILSNNETNNEEISNQIKDAETIFTYKAIKKCNKNLQIVTDLVSISNMEYLLEKCAITSKIEVDNTDNNTEDFKGFEFCPVFAAGEVYTSCIIDRITCQLYYNPNILTIIEQILSGGATNKNKKSVKMDKDLQISNSNMYLINIPDAFIGETFEKMFFHLLNSNLIIVIGLYRKAISNNFYYVFTNPSKQTILKRTDLIYALGNYNSILDIIIEKNISFAEKDENKNDTDENSEMSEKEIDRRFARKSSVFDRKQSKIYNVNLDKKDSKIKGKDSENLDVNRNDEKINNINKVESVSDNAVNKKNTYQNEVEKMSSKYQEINRIQDKVNEVASIISEVKKGYDNFFNYLDLSIREEIDNEISVYFSKKNK